MTLAGAGTLSAEAAPTAGRDLVARARDMEAAAWEEIYATHHRPLFRYAWFRLGDQSAAEDLAAEVFLAAVRGIGRYADRGVPLRAWLYRIAHNLCADERKRRGNGPPLAPEHLAETLAAPALPGTIDDRADLVLALRLLTAEQQQVVVLRFVEGLSLAEVAATIGRREGAVKSLQHRALLRLRELLGPGRKSA